MGRQVVLEQEGGLVVDPEECDNIQGTLRRRTGSCSGVVFKFVGFAWRGVLVWQYIERSFTFTCNVHKKAQTNQPRPTPRVRSATRVNCELSGQKLPWKFLIPASVSVEFALNLTRSNGQPAGTADIVKLARLGTNRAAANRARARTVGFVPPKIADGTLSI